jgi:putative DNA primase/helicase
MADPQPRPVAPHLKVAFKYREELGITNVVPAEGKSPVGRWKRWQVERMTDSDIRTEFGRAGRTCNFWMPTGRVNEHSVVDLDSAEAEAYVRELIGDAAFDGTARVRTGSGKLHLYFRTLDGWPTWRLHDPETGVSFDVQGDGAGVAIPPSVHESGHKYVWERGLEHALPMPEVLRKPLHGAKGTTGGDGPRSLLTALLEKLPEMREGDGRNDAMARVCGHYAKQFRHAEDAYFWHVDQANRMLGEPLEDAELATTAESIWRKEHEKDEPAPATAGSCEFIGRHGVVDVPALAQAAQGEARICLGHDRRLYRYVGGRYVPDGEDYLRARSRELLGVDFRKTRVNEVVAWFESELPTLAADQPLDVPNLANGLLDLETGELRDHDPDVLSTIQLPVAWRPDATAPTYERFVSEVLPGCEDLVDELLGYALYPSNPFQVAVLGLGSGSNGKSKFMRLVEALLGPANYSSVTLQAFSENRFAAADLYGMLANICGDLDARAVKRTDVFKMLTGGDTITAEHKYSRGFKFRSFATCFFLANEPPLTTDQSHAFFRRWIILPFDRTFTAGVDADPAMGDKLVAEVEGVLVHAVNGLRRLLERGHFDLPKSVVKANGEYRARLDTVQTFVEDCCTVGPERWVSKVDLYRWYREWAKESGHLPMSRPTFNQRLQDHLSDQIKSGPKREGDRRR